MQTVSPTLYQILLSSERDLTPVDLFEFYPPTVTDLIPANAERRFASTSLVWFGWEYQQQAISRSDISRYMTEKFNSVNITLSNVDKTVSTWLNGISLEGYRVLVRTVSRRYSTDSLVLFVGRCEKPGDIDNASVTITAKQDLGTIENELPFGKYDLKCPLKFKGTDCLAGQTIAQKPQAYKEASTCNKSWSQCVGYGNQKAFQGFRYKAVIGSFKVNTRPAGMGAIFGSRRATKQWTSTDNFPIGQSIPLGLGRTQIDLQPVLYADTGEYLYGHFVAGEGPITEFADVRNTTAGWATTFQTLYKHNGQYGYNADQETDSALLGLEYYSSRAYVEATIKGNNPDAGDPAPTLAALVLWNKIPSIGYAGFDTTDFSDNPVEHVRYLLTDPRALNYPTTWIDDEVSYQTAEYCNEPLQDDSGCEEFWYDQNQGTAGTDWKRYRSTGVLDSAYYKYQLTPTDANRPQKIAAEYNAYDPENPPENPIPTTYYRKRYTSNWHLKEPVKVADFLFKHLLPSFRGYLVTGADGKLQIKSERPAITSYLRGNANYEQTSISVQDVTTLLKLQLNQLYVVVGAGTDTSETKRVRSIIYNDLGNYFTLSVTQGATRYSPTFVGGSSNLFTSAPAWNYLTIQSGGLPVIVNVNGETITASAIDATGATATDGAIAGEIAAKINAHATLSQYIEAVWNKDNPTIVLMRSKTGYVYFDTGLVYAHQDGEAVVHVNGVFGDQAFGVLTRSNIIRDSFKWPLGQRQTSYNQFAITYTDSTQDFQQTELRENDYDHQDKVNKINKLEISGACVDNYHQADRLVQAARYKYRDGDYFCSFQAAGSALLLEEGDIICVNHANMSGRRNELFRIEELRVTQDHRVNIVARLYAEQQFPSAATVRTVGLNTGSVWIAGTPPAVTGVTVTYSTIDSGRVNFDFGDFVGGQTARVEIKRPGDADWIPTGYEVTPDSLGRGAAELPGLKVNTLIRITPISSTGVEGTPSQVTVTSPLYQWPGSYPSASGYVLSSTTAGVLSWVAQSGGGGTPGGSTTQVQFNDAGSFGGDAGLTYDKTTDALTVVGPTQMSELRLKETGGGSDYVGFKAPASVTSNKIWTLPDGDGNNGQVLTTNGSGTLQWRNGRDTLTGDRTYYVGFALTNNCTFTNGSAAIGCTSHGLSLDDPIIFTSTSSLPTNFIAGAVYYVRRVTDANTIEVSLTVGGTAISAGSAGSGTHTARTGNDSNAGFQYSNYQNNTQAANSRSIALLTIQKAIDLVSAIDLAGYAVTIQLAPGRYTDLVQLKSYVGVGPVTIKGDTAAATSYKLEPYALGLAMANANNDSIEFANHGLLAGTPISVVMYQPRPSGFDVSLNTTYYTYNVTTHSFQLVTSPTSTTPVTWTASPNSSGTTVSSISSTTITTSSGHGLVVNQAVMFTATSFPTNINGTTTYYVASAPSGTTFTISTTPGGAAITPGTSFTSLKVTPSVLYVSAWTVTSPTAPTGKYVLQGLNPIAPTSGISMRPTRSVLDIDNCNFGSAAASFNHVFAEVNCMVTFKNTTTISGGASTCDAFLATDGAYLTSRLGTFNVSASIVLSNFFRCLRTGIILADQTTYTNAANVTAGAKYNVSSNGVIQGPSASIPGPTAGTSGTTGGQFIDLA